MSEIIELSKKEIEKFLKDNQYGILSMGAKQPYALPMGYKYLRRTLILGITDCGRKMKYLNENKRVCFTICKPRWETKDLKVPCTSVVIEGELQEVKNKSYYGIKKSLPSGLKLFKIKTSTIGARKCNRKPCELFLKEGGK